MTSCWVDSSLSVQGLNTWLSNHNTWWQWLKCWVLSPPMTWRWSSTFGIKNMFFLEWTIFCRIGFATCASHRVPLFYTGWPVECSFKHVAPSQTLVSLSNQQRIYYSDLQCKLYEQVVSCRIRMQHLCRLAIPKSFYWQTFVRWAWDKPRPTSSRVAREVWGTPTTVHLSASKISHGRSLISKCIRTSVSLVTEKHGSWILPGCKMVQHHLSLHHHHRPEDCAASSPRSKSQMPNRPILTRTASLHEITVQHRSSTSQRERLIL